MEFLGRPLSVTLANAVKQVGHHSYFAVVFDMRPTEAAYDGKAYAESVQTIFDKVIGRASSPVEAASLYIDAHGACLVVDVRGAMSKANAKTAIKTFLAGLPAQQRDRALETLDALDELDKERIEAMETLMTCAPPPLKRQRTSEPSSSWKDAPTLAAQVAAFAESDSEPECEQQVQLSGIVAVQTMVQTALATKALAQAEVASAEKALCEHVIFPLTLERRATDEEKELHRVNVLEYWKQDDRLQVVKARLVDAEADFERRQFWELQAKRKATVVVASAGEHSLTYERCYLEHRRHLLLAKRLSNRPSFVEVVEAAAAMAEKGQLPNPGTGKQKSLFMGRCRKTLLQLNASAVSNVKDLPPLEQFRIALALGVSKPICPCGKPAKFPCPLKSWVTWYGGDVPELSDSCEAFCSAGCLERNRPKWCLQCLKADALESVEVGGNFFLRCSSCNEWGMTACTRQEVVEARRLEGVFLTEEGASHARSMHTSQEGMHTSQEAVEGRRLATVDSLECRLRGFARR